MEELDAEESEKESDVLDVFEEREDDEELDIYTEEGMETYMDEDGITSSEQGFMNGYLGA